MIYIKSLLISAGVDKAIGLTVLSRIIQAGGGLISIALISLFLNTDEQGYFYTFGSIIALQVFFELGLNNIITQYVAHELVNLEWKSKSELVGGKEYLSRLSSLLHFCVKTFSVLSILLLIGLIISGFIFFNKYQSSTNINWQLPWIIVSISTALMLWINPILAYLQGLGEVESVARIRLIQQTINITVIGLVLFFKGGLLASGLASFFSFISIAVSIFFTYRKDLLIFIYYQKDKWTVSYMKEIFPYQYKIALSWISGYLIFQLFNPVLFATESATVAGQMGMTLSALNGISSLSMSWINTKIPLMSSLIAKKNFLQLDKIFDKTLLQVFLVNLTLIIFFLVILYTLKVFNVALVQRFLPFLPLMLLCIVTSINQLVFSWATYLRCHKEEPFLMASLVTGILCSISTLTLSSSFGLLGIVGGYTIISLFISFPWAYYLFYSKKRIWHG